MTPRAPGYKIFWSATRDIGPERAPDKDLSGQDEMRLGQGKALGPVSFGSGAGYADSFVRAGTGPLDGQRRPTGNLIDPDEAPRLLVGHQRQIRACRIALDGLAARMALLDWAVAKAAAAEAALAEASQPAPPQPPAPSGRKPLLGLGKAAGRPAPPPRPSARPPVARPQKPPRPTSAPPTAPRTPEQARRAEGMAAAVAASPDLRRRAQIAIHQYRLAQETVQEAEQHLASWESLEPATLSAELGRFSLGKVQGMLVPLVNLAEAFRDAPALKANFELA
jgi:hypothetical protein